MILHLKIQSSQQDNFWNISMHSQMIPLSFLVGFISHFDLRENCRNARFAVATSDINRFYKRLLNRADIRLPGFVFQAVYHTVRRLYLNHHYMHTGMNWQAKIVATKISSPYILIFLPSSAKALADWLTLLPRQYR